MCVILCVRARVDNASLALLTLSRAHSYSRECMHHDHVERNFYDRWQPWGIGRVTVDRREDEDE